MQLASTEPIYVVNRGHNWHVYQLHQGNHRLLWSREFDNFDKLPEGIRFAVVWLRDCNYTEPEIRLGVKVNDELYVLKVTDCLLEEFEALQ